MAEASRQLLLDSVQERVYPHNAAYTCAYDEQFPQIRQLLRSHRDLRRRLIQSAQDRHVLEGRVLCSSDQVWWQGMSKARSSNC